jgi:pilus assembly protein Flp/PilA
LALGEANAGHREKDAAGQWDLTRYRLTDLFILSTGLKNMSKFAQFAFDFLKGEDGPTAVEYSVMLALIIVVCITAITTLGSNANGTFTAVGSAVNVSGS